ncbi:MAG TPA: hypothetical protein IAA52_13110 [Candidatus Pullichristensenella stercorigallinarum]|uniref:Glycosyltransferase RgtA/B/C/D-like domain-containing protein n=1 Tax=Candidatus Pullichristensenella stercorigallinarum TaxID=2840909 RepID=A0A9D1CXT2_9FIRM|nr:hypothetical protein [Candidatus Pullichristensenella stercorigallinarum]
MKRRRSGIPRWLAFSLLALAMGALSCDGTVAVWTLPGLVLCALAAVLPPLFARERIQRLAGAAACLGAWALLLVSFLCGGVAQTVLGEGLLLLAAAAFGLWWRRKLTWRRAAALLLLAAAVLRLAYVLCTPYDMRQHDGGGHIEYVAYLVEHNFRLPALDFDPREGWQFYHPPLNHLLLAVWVKLRMLLGATFAQSLESAQALSLFWSCAALYCCWRMFQALKIRGAGLFAACALVGFCPVLVINAAAVNNDGLLFLWEMALLNDVARWWRAPTAGRCARIGLFLGLAMATKLSGALLAFPLAALFLAALYRHRRRMGAMWRQYALFLLICAPLGLAYPVYNLLRWGMPLNYVLPLAEDAAQLIRKRTALERLFVVTKEQFLRMFIERDTVGLQDHNVFLALLKTAAFDEYMVSGAVGVAVAVYASQIAAAVLSAACAVRAAVHCARRRYVGVVNAFLALTAAVLLLSYVKFCFEYPFVCTEHIRYVLPLIPLFAALAGKFAPRTGAAVGCAVALSALLMFALLGWGIQIS